MQAYNLLPQMNVHTDLAYLNTEKNPHFVSKNLVSLNYIDRDIISNGSYNEEKAVNIIVSGKVRVLRMMLNSDNIVSYDLGVGDIFGLENIISATIQPSQIVSAIGDVAICRIHIEDILEQIKDVNVLKELFNHYIRTMNYVINP